MKPKSGWKVLGIWGTRLALVAGIVTVMASAWRWLDVRAENRMLLRQAIDKVALTEAAVKACENGIDSLGCELEKTNLTADEFQTQIDVGFSLLLGEDRYKSAVLRAVKRKGRERAP